MNIEQLRQKQGEAKSKAGKDDKAKLADLMSQVEEREKIRLAAVGQLEAAQQAAHRAQGEITAAESNLNRVVTELETLIQAVENG